MSTALARRMKLQVSADATTWVDFKGVNDLNAPISPNLQAADDYDTNGWSAFEKTMQGWVVTAKARRATTAGVFDPGQELVRSRMLGFDDAARIYVRWFDRNGAAEAYQGRAIVGWVASKTGVADLDEITATFTGDGVLAAITNPGVAATVATITAVTPLGAGTGALVTISGAGFSGTVATTGVKFNAVNATSFTVVSDNTIVATVPTGGAGVGNVIVTNAQGASAAFAYTRAA